MIYPWSTPCLSTSGGVCGAEECPDGGEMLSAGVWHYWTWTHSVSASVTWSPLTQTSLELGWVSAVRSLESSHHPHQHPTSHNPFLQYSYLKGLN